MRKRFLSTFLQPLSNHYYIDATNGNDNNSGLSEGNAWKTITKVNSSTFKPGDKILFKCGEVWTGTCLIVPSSGTLLRHIYFGSYGTGDKPVIDGNDAVNCIECVSKTSITFENIEVTQGLEFGFSISGSSYIDIISCDAHDCGNDNIIFMSTSHDCSAISCNSYNAYARTVGPIISCLEVGDACYNIEIDSLTAYGSEQVGVTIHCHNGIELPNNITLTNCTVRNNTTSGIQVGIAEAGGLCSEQKNILIDSCQVYSNGLYGVRLFTADTTYVSGITFIDCSIYANTSNAIQCVGDNVTFIKTLASGRGSVFTNCKNASLKNVTIYNASDSVAALGVSGTRTENFYGRNNIIMNNVAGQVIINVAAGCGTGWDMDYTLYRRTGGLVTNAHWYWLGTGYNWADWKTQTTKDANSPTPADPLFTDAGNNIFTLQIGSPAIDKGIHIAGITDGYLGTAPDCGAYEKA